jgi:hypothetical protein
MGIAGRCIAKLLLPLFVFPALSHAHEGRIAVTLAHTGADSAGKRLAQSIRSELALSKLMTLVKASDDRIGVYLVTMRRGGESPGTIYSVTWTLGGMTDDGYLTSRVGSCDAGSVRACARRLVAETDTHARVLFTIRHNHPPAR